MRKLISTFAMLAIVVTMFSGVSYAADRDAKIVLDNDYVVYESGFMSVSGRIVDEETNATITSADNEVYLVEDDSFTTTASSGRFTLTFRMGVGNYNIGGDTGGDVITLDSATFRVIPELALDTNSTLDFSYPVDGQTTVQGTFINEDGNDFSTVEIGYVNEDTNTMDGAAVVTADYHENDAFGFLFDGDLFNKTGKIGIFVDDVLALEGRIAADELSVSMSPTDVPRKIGPQPVTFSFDLASKYVDGSDMETGYELRYKITDSEGTVKVSERALVDDGNNDFDNSSDQKVTVDLDCNDWATDDYVARITLEDGSNVVIGEKELDFEIVRADDYTLMGWSLGEVSVGDIKFSLPDSSDTTGTSADYPDKSSNNIDQQIQVKEDDGYDVRFFEIEVDGAGVDETFTNFGDDKVDGDMHTITPTETGDMDIVIKAYSSETASSPVETFNRTVTITGYNVSISPQEVQADSNTDIVINITDEDGNAVNNASVYINSIRVVNGNVENIQNGRYVYEDDEENFFEEVGGLDVEVRGWLHDTYLTIDFEDAIQVVGDEVYTVSSDKDSLVNGFEDTIYVTTKDGSDEVYPDLIERIDVDKDGKMSSPVTLTGRGYEDLDDDGVREAVELRLTPNNTQEAIIIRTSTDDGKKMGEVRLDITGPEVEMLAAESATENFRSDFEFTAQDPRDDSDLDSSVYFSANREYIDYSLRDGSNNSISVNSTGVSASRRPNRDDVYEFEVYVDDVDWEKAEDDEQDLYISVYAESSGDEDIKLYDIPVRKAMLTSDPSEITMGSQANTFTFSYVDGDGNPLEGYELYLEDDEIGETNEDGQVMYNTQATGLSITITAETDDNDDDDSDILNPSSDNEDTIYTEYKIKAVVDAQGPVASAPATVNQDTVVITIEDNSAVNKVMINGEPVDIFFPMPKVTELYQDLDEGDNDIVVEAVDINNNYRKTELTVTYVTETSPGPDSVQLTVGNATAYGVPELVDGTTMVPARFVEELGVTFTFDSQTKTATYKYGDNTVSVTNNRSTAIVNGTEVLMTEQAYINDQGRFMVPLRMVGEELGFEVQWISNDQPITITR